jgi:hypothetical protein
MQSGARVFCLSVVAGDKDESYQRKDNDRHGEGAQGTTAIDFHATERPEG